MSSLLSLLHLQTVDSSSHRQAFTLSMWSPFPSTILVYVICYIKYRPTPKTHTHTHTRTTWQYGAIWHKLVSRWCRGETLRSEHHWQCSQVGNLWRTGCSSNPPVRQTVDITQLSVCFRLLVSEKKHLRHQSTTSSSHCYSVRPVKKVTLAPALTKKLILEYL